MASFSVTNLGHQTVIIGHSWLQHNNPLMDWITQEVPMMCCPSSCSQNLHVVDKSPNRLVLEGDAIYAISLPETYTDTCAHIPEECLLPELLPHHYYLDFTDVFSKGAFAHLPPPQCLGPCY